MDADPNIATWVLDFLLRGPLEEQVLIPLLRALPVSSYEPFLGKLLLLNKIENEVSSHSVSERTLKLLERLEEIKFLETGGRVSETMRRAYCAVAVDCTVRILVNGNYRDDEVRLKYFNAVVKFWRRRLMSMERKTENRGLWSEDLLMWKGEIEAAVLDDDVCESIVKKLADVNACEAVQAYVKEERENMGPAFLDVVANAAKDDDVLHKVVSVPGVAGELPNSNSSAIAVNVGDIDRGILKGKAHLQKHTTGSASPLTKRVKFVDEVETIYVPSVRGLNLPSTSSFKRIRKSIRLSSVDLQAVVKDPLPDAIMIAEAISGVSNEGKCHYPAEENLVEDMSGVSGGHKYPEEVPVEPISATGDVQGICNSVAVLPSLSVMQLKAASASTNPDLLQQKASTSINADLLQQKASTSINPDLMQQKASTSTKLRHEQRTSNPFQVERTTNPSQVDPDTDGGMSRLPSPRSINISPLKKSEDEAPKRKRRRPRRWSSFEEDTLRAAVKKFGSGNWKYILKVNEDVFLGRTEVDLKDKWRNMMR